MADPLRPIYDKTSIALHHQVALGFALPPILPFQTIVRVKGIDRNGQVPDESLQQAVNSGLANLASTFWQVPLTLKLSTEAQGFMLPIDPLIAISGSNKLVRRYVAKSSKRGSIKERWSQDDYEITITGILSGDENYTLHEYLQRLRTYLEAPESVSVVCDLLNNVFDIFSISIDTYEFPFTQGEDNQQFTIKAYSDDSYSLLIDGYV